jgi:hypothetical protein
MQCLLKSMCSRGLCMLLVLFRHELVEMLVCLEVCTENRLQTKNTSCTV